MISIRKSVIDLHDYILSNPCEWSISEITPEMYTTGGYKLERDTTVIKIIMVVDGGGISNKPYVYIDNIKADFMNSSERELLYTGAKQLFNLTVIDPKEEREKQFNSFVSSLLTNTKK